MREHSLQGEQYRVARKLGQESAAAIQLIRTVVANHGFRVETQGADCLECTSPGLNSTRQNPILGAGKMSIQIMEGYLTISADLASARRLQKFVYWFPWILGLSLGVTLGIVQGIIFGYQTGSGFGIPGIRGWMWMLLAVGGGVVPVVPWLFLSPLLARKLEKRTKLAIDTLCINAAG